MYTSSPTWAAGQFLLYEIASCISNAQLMMIIHWNYNVSHRCMQHSRDLCLRKCATMSCICSLPMWSMGACDIALPVLVGPRTAAQAIPIAMTQTLLVDSNSCRCHRGELEQYGKSHQAKRLLCQKP